MPRLSYSVAEVALRVSDLERSKAFYVDILGFEPHLSMENIEFLEIGALNSPLGRDHPQLLALFKRDIKLDQATSTFDHIAFEVPEEDFASERARYEELGMVISERDWPDTLPWRGSAFFFRDPDDNVVEIIAAKASAWVS